MNLWLDNLYTERVSSLQLKEQFTELKLKFIHIVAVPKEDAF